MKNPGGITGQDNPKENHALSFDAPGSIRLIDRKRPCGPKTDKHYYFKYTHILSASPSFSRHKIDPFNSVAFQNSIHPHYLWLPSQIIKIFRPDKCNMHVSGQYKATFH